MCFTWLFYAGSSEEPKLWHKYVGSKQSSPKLWEGKYCLYSNSKKMILNLPQGNDSERISGDFAKSYEAAQRPDFEARYCFPEAWSEMTLSVRWTSLEMEKRSEAMRNEGSAWTVEAEKLSNAVKEKQPLAK